MSVFENVFARQHRARSWLALPVVLALAAGLLAVTAQPAGADSNDFSTVDFAASGPDTYDHATGGGFWADNVEQLQGGDFACGEVASYLVQLVNDGSGAGAADDPESVEIFTRFSAINGGQQGVGHIDVTNVQINTADPANIDLADTASVFPTAEFYGNSDTPPIPSGIWTTVPGSYSPTEPYEEYLHFGFQVDGINAGDTIIVRIDVLLGCDLTKSKVTGTMAGQLESATALSDNAEFAGGRQTIPFISLGEFAFGNPSLAVTKTVTDVDGDGTGAGPADAAGDVITYEIEVENTGDIPLTGVTVEDPLLEGPHGTLTNDADEDGEIDGDTNNDGALDVDETWTWTGTYTVQQSDLDDKGGGDGDIDNTATADSDQTEPLDDSADVPLLYDPKIGLVKALHHNNDEDGSGTVSIGDTLMYSFTIRNDGNVTLTNVTLADPKVTGPYTCDNTVPDNDEFSLPGTLHVGDSVTCYADYTVTVLDEAAGEIVNIAVADSDESDPDDDTWTVPVPVANRRSILVRLKNDANTPDVQEDFSYTDGDGLGTVEGNFSILNKSSQSKIVGIKDFSIYVEWAIGTGRNAWTAPEEVEGCTFDPDAPLFLAGDATLAVLFVCTDAVLNQPEGARAIRITVVVEIANKEGATTVFQNSDSRPL